MAARIIRGESPATMPFEPLTETRILVNLEAASKQGFEVPASVVKRADKIIGG
jgi:putative ABC transport system substrate-binding protein